MINFWEKTAPAANGCIEWQGPLDRHGYGRVSEGRLAHRIAYMLVKGDPSGKLVCHSCDNPRCVNPDHLWLGTVTENNRDAVAKGRFPGMARTHCKNGHEYTPENTYRRPGTAAGRDCRLCIRDRVVAYKARQSSNV